MLKSPGPSQQFIRNGVDDFVRCRPADALFPRSCIYKINSALKQVVEIFKSNINLGTYRKIDFGKLGPIGVIVRFGWLDVMQYPNGIFLEQNKVILEDWLIESAIRTS